VPRRYRAKIRSNKAVMASEMRMEPMQPRRLLKRKNMLHLRVVLSAGAPEHPAEAGRHRNTE
jgi:hypothetical protein